MAAGVAEAMWLHHITDALGLPPFRTKIYCDNESTICVTKNLVLHDRMKHVGSDCHFVREQVMAGTMSTHHVPSSEQLADILTKPLPPPHHIPSSEQLADIPTKTLPLPVFYYLATKLSLVPVDQLAGDNRSNYN